jgi:hypothetical protein
MPKQTTPSPEEARQLAKEAYVYGFPLAANYQTLYKQVLDTTGHDYRAAFNTLANSSGVATPDDKFVVTPNSALNVLIDSLSTRAPQPKNKRKRRT